MELNNSKEITKKLVDMFKNKSNENPVKIKNFYYYLKNLNFIVFLADDESVYWQIDKYKTDEDRIYATVFVDETVFLDWKIGKEVNYKIIDFNGLIQLLNCTYSVNNTSAIIVALLDLKEDFLHFKLDIDDIREFEHYVLMYNSISEKNAYVVGRPKNNHEELLKKLESEIKQEQMIKSAFYVQLLSPPQDNGNIIESHKPNTAYFTIIYDTVENFSAAKCLDFQERCTNFAKEFGVDVLIAHKKSQVGMLAEPTLENTFYIANKD